MTRAKHALIAMVVAVIGSWGCARSTPPTTAVHHLDRLKMLETKNAKLEEDFRAAAVARDQLRKQLADAQTHQRQMRADWDEQARTLTREREELRREVAQRTGERDAMGVQYEQFRKSIRELLGQAETALSRPVDQPPVTTANAAAVPGKS